jgi:PAS domain S-box-containing protein
VIAFGPRFPIADGLRTGDVTIETGRQDPAGDQAPSRPAGGATSPLARPARAPARRTRLHRALRTVLRNSWIIALVSGIASTAVVFLLLWESEGQRAQSAFRQRASQRLDAFEANVRLATEKIQSMGAYFDTLDNAQEMGQERFERLAGSLWSVDSIIQALEWAPRVPGAGRAQWERRLRERSPRAIGILERTPGGLATSARRSEYFPIEMVYPLVGNERAMGYDLASDGARGAALHQAALSGSVVATPRVTLVQESGGDPAFLLFRPVYRGGSVPIADAERNQLLLGFTIGVFRIGDIIAGAEGDTRSDPVEPAPGDAPGAGHAMDVKLAAFDVQAGPGERLLYPRGTDIDSESDLGARPGFVEARTLIVGDRTWRIAAYAAYDSFLADHRTSNAAAASGLLLSLVIAAYLRQAIRRQSEIQEVVARRTAELRLAHVDLELESEKNRMFLRSATDGVHILDREGRLVEASDSFARALGYTREQMLGMHVARWDSWFSPDELTRVVARNFATRDPTTFETVHRRQDGSTVEVEVTAQAIEIDADLLLFCSSRDITARKRADRQIREQIAFNEKIVIESPVGLVVYRSDGACVLANDAIARLVGATREQLLAGNFRLLESWRTSGLYEAAVAALGDGENRRHEVRVAATHGKEVWLECQIVPIHLHGEPHLLLQYSDLSEIRRAEDALRRARDQAESASRAKSQFLATMSHEIRTPLNGVLGMAQLLQAGELSEEERREYAATIVHSGQALLALLNDILDLSKVEAGRMEFAREPFLPSELLGEVARLFAEMASGKGIALESRWEGEARAYRGDANRIRQMLVNLANNAVKFTQAGAVRIYGRARTLDGGAIELHFDVHDTGPGIRPEHLANLFQPFTQLAHVDTRKEGGTGLGLSIVRKLAQGMGGDATARSSPGAGSTFSFHVRVEVVAPVAPTDAGAPAPDAPAATHAPGNPAAARILVAEDNAVNQKVVGAILRKLGYEHRIVGDGQQALEAIAYDRGYCLVLMDCQMPVLDGYAAATAIRARESIEGRTRMPIVALSAAAYEEDIARCHEAGMDDFLPKPVNIKALSAMIERWLVPAPRAQASAQTAEAPQRQAAWSG